MKNIWLERRVQRKAFVIGDLVFWDKNVFSDSDMTILTSRFGIQPFQVLSMPFMQIDPWNGQPYIVVDIGRMGFVLTRTEMKNLIKV